jgi:hypothetical protein
VLGFTTESYAYTIQDIIAKASSSAPGMGPEKTVDSSGLNADDQHSTELTQMWLSEGVQPNWIQYEFDGLYKLHELWVWNSNQLIEPSVGLGARKVTIEYSIDAQTWVALDGVPEFTQAPGLATYIANTIIDFGGVMAKYVKLTVDASWGGTAKHTGLSEVRFLYVPVYARQPVPASGQEAVSVDTSLSWKSGREVASHRVYFATEQEAVADDAALIDIVTDSTFDPGPLDLGRTYFWRVDEVNEAATPSVRQGEIWSFSTREYLVVDDFEDYNNDQKAGTCIFQTWADGWINETGSRVGHTQSPFAERAVVHGGKQSMPLDYNNIAGPFYSEVERTFSPVQDWTASGADTFRLCFRGHPIGFLERSDGSIQMSGVGESEYTSDKLHFAYKQLSGDGSITAKLHSLPTMPPYAWAGLMIRRYLYPTSSYACMNSSADKLRMFAHRTVVSGGAKGVWSDIGAVTFPIWVKVERKGNDFTGYYSQDGQNWIKQPANELGNSTNPVRITMGSDVYIGLAVTSTNAIMPTIAEFSDVSFTGAVTGDWQVEAIGAKQPSNDPAPLYVAIEDDAGKVRTITHPDPAAVLAIAWQQWLIPLSDLTSAGVRLTSVKKMSIGIGDPSHPTAGGAGVIYIDDIGVGHPLSE